MVFIGAAILIAIVGYGAYRYVSDPLARAAAHTAVREDPWTWALTILMVAVLIAGVLFIMTAGP